MSADNAKTVQALLDALPLAGPFDASVRIDLRTGAIELHAAGGRSCEFPQCETVLSELTPDRAAAFAALSVAVHRIVRPVVQPLLAGSDAGAAMSSARRATGTGGE